MRSAECGMRNGGRGSGIAHRASRIPHRVSRITASAFTLVELVVVIVIVAVLATMAVPRLSGRLSSSQLRASAQAFLMTVRYARDFAATRRRVCRLAMDRESQRYGLQYQKDPEHRPGLFVPIRSGVGKAGALQDGIRFARIWIEPAGRRERTADCVTFETSGEADAAIVEITDGKRTMSVVLVPSSGRALLVDGIADERPNDRRDLDV